MLDNTLICDCVWIKDAAEGEMNTRYFMRSNSCDEQGQPKIIKPAGHSLY